MIQEYHAIMQTKILKEYIFYPVGFIIVYTSKLFPTEQLLFISFPFFSIQYFNYSGKIYKNCNLWSNSLVKYIFGYQNHQLKNWQALVKKNRGILSFPRHHLTDKNCVIIPGFSGIPLLAKNPMTIPGISGIP